MEETPDVEEVTVALGAMAVAAVLVEQAVAAVLVKQAAALGITQHPSLLPRVYARSSKGMYSTTELPRRSV